MILAWEFTCVAFGISDLVLPRPSQIARVLGRNTLTGPHAYQTLYTTLIGFAIGVAVGVLLGVAVGSSALVYETVYPLLIGFYSIPKVAIVPILVIQWPNSQVHVHLKFPLISGITELRHHTFAQVRRFHLGPRFHIDCKILLPNVSFALRLNLCKARV